MIGFDVHLQNYKCSNKQTENFKLDKLFQQHISNLEFIKEAFTLMNGMFFWHSFVASWEQL